MCGDADIERMLSYKKLDVYRCAIELLALISDVLDTLAKSKGNSTISEQLKGAGFSIPLNIAEATGRSTVPDQAKHYIIARGSAMECGAIFDVLVALRLLDTQRATKGEDLVERIVSMLTKMCHF